jgi:DNA mismatch repair ATPase MutS
LGRDPFCPALGRIKDVRETSSPFRKDPDVLIDSKTARDLELFQTRDGKPGIFQALDLTKTPGGSRALRFRFENPMSDPAHIRQVQAGVRFLVSQGIGFDLDADLVREVHAYVDSPWDVTSRAHGLRFYFESLFVSLGYRDLFQHARHGVAATRRLISQALPFLKRIREQEPPSEVLRPVENLLALIDRLRLDQLRTEKRPWTIASTDRYLRLSRKTDFQRFFSLLYDLDALIAMAGVIEKKGFVLPEVVDGSGFLLEGEGVFHPLLSKPVGNPIGLGDGKALVFLTGPNMAGKTTYLKAVTVSALLAHVGMGVPAERLRFSPLDAVYSSLSPEENLLEGLSYFMAEVRRVREVAAAVAGKKKALVVFDEVFRGTNVKDALDASRLVIRGLAKSRNSGFIFASHLVELADGLAGDPAIQFAHFDGQIRNDQAWYEFRLKDGVSRQRFGLQLLQQEEVPQILESIEN